LQVGVVLPKVATVGVLVVAVADILKAVPGDL
jgi:hypothetical protein